MTCDLILSSGFCRYFPSIFATNHFTLILTFSPRGRRGLTVAVFVAILDELSAVSSQLSAYRSCHSLPFVNLGTFGFNPSLGRREIPIL